MSHNASNLVSFVGCFHPLLVHLPIGGLVLLGFLELLAAVTRWKEAAQNGQWILGFTSGAAVVSAVCGWMLATTSGYNTQLVNWHRALGLALSSACLLTFLLRYQGRLGAYRVLLVATLLLLVATSHLGASITHGPDFFTRHAPTALRSVLGRLTPRGRQTPAASSPLQRSAFAEIVEPILQERCSSCHGAAKQKAELRLDSIDGLLRGGQDGPVIRAGQAKDSLLVQCLLSPVDADGHMPPEDHPQLTHAEIALLEWWINDGAPATETVVELNPNPEIRRLLEIVSGRPQPAKLR